MVRFAQRLHDATNWSLSPGPDYFSSLWQEALVLEADAEGPSRVPLKLMAGNITVHYLVRRTQPNNKWPNSTLAS